MPPAKKTAQKPNTEESEQSVSTTEDVSQSKVARKKKVEAPVVDDVVMDSSDDPISKINQEKVMVFMKNGYSYSSPEVSFTREQPFQLMNAIEAARLINSMEYRFDYATKEQVEEFYSLG